MMVMMMIIIIIIIIMISIIIMMLGVESASSQPSVPGNPIICPSLHLP